jgi:hypothetical protein
MMSGLPDSQAACPKMARPPTDESRRPQSRWNEGQSLLKTRLLPRSDATKGERRDLSASTRRIVAGLSATRERKSQRIEADNFEVWTSLEVADSD